MNPSYSRYSQAYQKAAVNTVDQGKLIVMLYDGAIKFLTLAADKVSKGDAYEAHQNLSKAKNIIAELMGSLNVEKGGEIATNLQRLYAYMYNELIEANLNRDAKRLMAVTELLKELREGWKTVAATKPEGQAKADGSTASTGAGQRGKQLDVKG